MQDKNMQQPDLDFGNLFQPRQHVVGDEMTTPPIRWQVD
jgi:hypothetical protein